MRANSPASISSLKLLLFFFIILLFYYLYRIIMIYIEHDLSTIYTPVANTQNITRAPQQGTAQDDPRKCAHLS